MSCRKKNRVALGTNRQRSHLADLVPVAIGTGLRKNELLGCKISLDFARNLLVVIGTKTRKNREVRMNPEVREIMLRLCRSKADKPGVC